MTRRVGWLLTCVSAIAFADGTLDPRVTGSTTAPLPFLEYLPPGYTGGSDRLRLVLMFHGVGESGAGTNATELRTSLSGAGPMMRIRDALNAGQTPMFATSHRAIVLSPRNPSGLWNMGLAVQFYDWALANYRVDERFIYLTGLSAGGGPTWMIPTLRPQTVAAVLPICPVIATWPPSSIDASAYRAGRSTLSAIPP